MYHLGSRESLTNLTDAMKNDNTMNDSDKSEGRKSRPSPSDEWQQRDDEGETGWDRGESSPALIRWLDDGDLTPCRILVPGCGRGHEVVELASRGFDVTALDFARTPVRELTH